MSAPHKDEWGVRGYTSLISVLDGAEWSTSCSSHFTHGETATSNHKAEAWVCPKARLDAMQEEIYLLPLPIP
jgi:hypothetical protein